jgi:hypothetical protein
VLHLHLVFVRRRPPGRCARRGATSFHVLINMLARNRIC